MTLSAINRPIPLSRNPNGYVTGLTASLNSTTPNTQLDLAAGACSDSLNNIDMVLSTGVTINSAKNGINGLDKGIVLTASSIYYVYVIGDSNGFNLPVGMISLLPTNPYLPFGYDSFRMVDIKATDSSAHFILSYTNGKYGYREFVYDAPILVLNAGSDATATAVSLVNVVAPIGTPMVKFTASITPVAVTGAGDSISIVPTGSSSASYAKLSGGIVSKAQIADLGCLAFVASGVPSVDYVVTDSGDVASLWVKSFQYNV